MAREKTEYKTIKGTVIPEAFQELVDRILKYGEAKHRSTVTTFSNDSGMFVSIPKQGSTANKICLFLNKSRGWKPSGEYDCVEIDTWHTGDVRVIVSSDIKSIKQAVLVCKEWIAAKPEHTPQPRKFKRDEKEEKETKTKKAKSGNGEEKVKSKKHKKSKKHVEEEVEA